MAGVSFSLSESLLKIVGGTDPIQLGRRKPQEPGKVPLRLRDVFISPAPA
jgi:hypothetical protein